MTTPKRPAGAAEGNPAATEALLRFADPQHQPGSQPLPAFDGADLSAAGLGSRVQGAAWWDTKRGGVRLAACRLAGASLRGANLSGADLAGADLSKTTCSGIMLRGAQFRRRRRMGKRLHARRARTAFGRREVGAVLRPCLLWLADVASEWVCDYGESVLRALFAAGDFEPFATVLGGALDQVRAEQCRAPSVSARAGLMAQMKHLPARPDAREARRPRLGSNLAEPCRCRPPKPIWTLAKTRNRGKSRPTPKPAPAPEVIAWVNW